MPACSEWSARASVPTWLLGCPSTEASSRCRGGARWLGGARWWGGGHLIAVRFEEAIGLWREGQRRLASAQPPERPVLERVTDEIVHELRRRLGGPFTTQELATLYTEQGTDWCFAIATRVAPREPGAWDLTTVAGAAFARYTREASDYAGGRL